MFHLSRESSGRTWIRECLGLCIVEDRLQRLATAFLTHKMFVENKREARREFVYSNTVLQRARIFQTHRTADLDVVLSRFQRRATPIGNTSRESAKPRTGIAVPQYRDPRPANREYAIEIYLGYNRGPFTRAIVEKSDLGTFSKVFSFWSENRPDRRKVRGTFPWTRCRPQYVH